MRLCSRLCYVFLVLLLRLHKLVAAQAARRLCEWLIPMFMEGDLRGFDCGDRICVAGGVAYTCAAEDIPAHQLHSVRAQSVLATLTIELHASQRNKQSMPW